MSGFTGSGGAAYSSARHDWATPQALFEELDAEFHFDLDAAASPWNAKCADFYAKEDDGLSRDWSGRTVWLNPPYGREIGKWVAKAADESRKPGTTVVLLVPARTDTAWFHDCLLGRAELRFLRGRLRFEGAEFNAPFPSMVAVLGAAAAPGSGLAIGPPGRGRPDCPESGPDVGEGGIPAAPGEKDR